MAASARPAGAAVADLVIDVGLPDIGRRAAQELARRELSKAIYQPSGPARVAHWLVRQAARLFTDLNPILPGGWWALICLLIALVVVVWVVLVQLRPGGARRGGGRGPLAGQPISAAGHRRLADGHAAAGDYTAAIVEQVRALAGELQERGLLPARPGRTAAELAAEASRPLPALAGQLAEAARLFDDVRYGGRSGTADAYRRVRETDFAIQAAIPSAAVGAAP